MKHAFLCAFLALNGGTYEYNNVWNTTHVKMELRWDKTLVIPQHFTIYKKTCWMADAGDPKDDAMPWLRELPGWRFTHDWDVR